MATSRLGHCSVNEAVRKIIIGLLAVGFVGFGLGEWRSLAADGAPASGASSATPAAAGRGTAWRSHAWPRYAPARSRRQHPEGATKPDKPHPRRIALGELDASITRQRAQLGQRTVQSSNPRGALIAQEAAISGGASS